MRYKIPNEEVLRILIDNGIKDYVLHLGRAIEEPITISYLDKDIRYCYSNTSTNNPSRYGRCYIFSPMTDLYHCITNPDEYCYIDTEISAHDLAAFLEKGIADDINSEK